MKKIVNRAEFEALIERYESITIEEINNSGDFVQLYTIAKITGFGDSYTCSLCKPTCLVEGSIDCRFCMWFAVVDSIPSPWGSYCIYHDTYANINDANFPRLLLTAVKARAKYMRKVLNKFDHENKKDNNQPQC